MTPYNKVQLRNNPDCDIYNFYLRQLRIRIEQALGLLVGKWRSFKQPLCTKLANIPHIVSGCMRLHNFCITQHLANEEFNVAVELADIEALNNVAALSYYDIFDEDGMVEQVQIFDELA